MRRVIARLVDAAKDYDEDGEKKPATVWGICLHSICLALDRTPDNPPRAYMPESPGFGGEIEQTSPGFEAFVIPSSRISFVEGLQVYAWPWRLYE